MLWKEDKNVRETGLLKLHCTTNTFLQNISVSAYQWTKDTEKDRNLNNLPENKSSKWLVRLCGKISIIHTLQYRVFSWCLVHGLCLLWPDHLILRTVQMLNPEKRWCDNFEHIWLHISCILQHRYGSLPWRIAWYCLPRTQLYMLWPAAVTRSCTTQP